MTFDFRTFTGALINVIWKWEIGWQNLSELNSLISAAIIFIIFWDSLMFYQILLSPQVKQCAIITYKLGIYKHESPATSTRHRDQAPTTTEHGNKQPRRTPPPRSTIEQNTNADISTEQPEDPSNPPHSCIPRPIRPIQRDKEQQNHRSSVSSNEYLLKIKNLSKDIHSSPIPIDGISWKVKLTIWFNDH